MSLFYMKWSEFFQISILYPLFLGGLIYSIILLNNEGLDTYFLITFIIAILTIILSIYYSGKTNEVFNKITEKIARLQIGNEGLKLSIDALNEKLNKSEDTPITETEQGLLDKTIKQYMEDKK